MTICPICKQKTASKYKSAVKSVYSSKAYDIRHCSNCGHFFTAPLPSGKELDDIYTNKYSYDAHSLIESEKRMRAKNYANYIAKIPKTKTALEVGCMHGLLLTELERNGVAASGVELDPEAVKYCQEHGLDVTQGSIENHLKKAGSKHDVIIMSHVIEHIVDPEQQLKSLYKRMSKNGRLVLITPNSMARTRRLFGRFWGYWQVPVHINHFNKTSMAQLLKNSGFKVEETKYYGADSLFFLSSLANLLGARNDTKSLSPAKKMLVRAATRILRPWYHVGREDMLVTASKA
jgi:2-polyprenyl-3-methyl-5-hydroxy-6-metoxy-1,4-benzoquinol methylase